MMEEVGVGSVVGRGGISPDITLTSFSDHLRLDLAFKTFGLFTDVRIEFNYGLIYEIHSRVSDVQLGFAYFCI